MAFSAWSHSICGALLAVAAAADVGQRRIPNAIVVALATCALVARIGGEGAWSAAAALGTGAAVGFILVLAWQRRIVGGGDVKLAAAAAMCVGPQRIGTYALVTALAGGVLAILCIATTLLRQRTVVPDAGDGCATPAMLNLARVRAATVPYGAAIACGAAAAMFWG